MTIILRAFIMCTLRYFSLAGGRDPTRPEYVVSDMLQPLPEWDWNFVLCDTAPEAACDVRPAAAPVGGCRSAGLSGPSYAAVTRGDEGDAASQFLSSDDSFSSGNESSPGGLRKRHNVSPFRTRVDKKSLQVAKGDRYGGIWRGPSDAAVGHGRGVRRGRDSDSEVGQPLFRFHGQDLRHVTSDGVVSQSTIRGCGRGRCRSIQHDLSSDSVVGQPLFHVHGQDLRRATSDAVVSQSASRGRGIRRGSFSDNTVGHPGFRLRGHSLRRGTPSGASLDQSVPQPELQSDVSAAAWGDALWVDSGHQHEMRQTRSVPCRDSYDHHDTGLHLSSAAWDDTFPPAEHQCTPAFLERPVSGQATGEQVLSDVIRLASLSAESAGAADIGIDLPPLRCRRQKVAFAPLSEQCDGDADGHVDAEVDTEVELIKFEPPVR